MPRYELTLRTMGRHPRIPLSAEDFLALQQARHVESRAVAIEEAWGYVVANYEEFESDMLASVLQAGLYHDNPDLIGIMHRLCRRLVNLLSVGRAYLDQMDRAVKDHFGGESDELRRVRAACSAEYDAKLGYRVCYHLRNHVHRGFPVHGITSGGGWQDRPGGGSVRAEYVTPRLSVGSLRDDRDFKADVLRQLEDIGERHDLKPLVRQFVESLSRIHGRARELLANDVAHADAIVRTAIERYRAALGERESTLGLAAYAYDEDDSEPSERFDLAMSGSERLLSLTRRHKVPLHIERFVVTSEAVPLS